MKAVRDGDSEAGRAVTVQGRKLCAEIAHEERRNRPLSVAIGIVWAKHFGSGLFLFVFIQLERWTDLQMGRTVPISMQMDYVT